MNTQIIISQPRAIINSKYSYLVSLPHSWLWTHQIGKGDQIAFSLDEENNLVLKPVKEETCNSENSNKK